MIEDAKEARGQERRRGPKRKSVRRMGISKQSGFIQIESEMNLWKWISVVSFYPYFKFFVISVTDDSQDP